MILFIGDYKLILLMAQWKLFPLRLPPGYHGKQKPVRKLSEINRQKSNERENPEYMQTKIGHWQTKRLDRDVINERRNYIVHPAKLSQDTPDWFKTTHHYFARGNYAQINKGKIDINNSSFFGKTQSNQDSGLKYQGHSRFMSQSHRFRLRGEAPVTEKIGGSRDPSLSGTRWFPMRQEVTGKVGSVEVRDFSIRRPQLKIGTRQQQNFINTYSVA